MMTFFLFHNPKKHEEYHGIALNHRSCAGCAVIFAWVIHVLFYIRWKMDRGSFFLADALCSYCVRCSLSWTIQAFSIV
jgi:hypothetical protein